MQIELTQNQIISFLALRISSPPSCLSVSPNSCPQLNTVSIVTVRRIFLKCKSDRVRALEGSPMVFRDFLSTFSPGGGCPLCSGHSLIASHGPLPLPSPPLLPATPFSWPSFSPLFSHTVIAAFSEPPERPCSASCTRSHSNLLHSISASSTPL